MKYLRATILMFAVLILPYLLNSCGDTGVAPEPKVTGITLNNLSPLNTNIDGYYEAWVSVQETPAAHGDDAYRTLGKFNVRTDGSIVDPNGNAFSLNAVRIDLSKVEDAIISVEVPGDNDTLLNGTKILGAEKSEENGNLVFHLSMNYSHVLGSAGPTLSIASAKYILAAPSDTTNDPNRYKRGAWYTQDTLGQSAGLTLGQIPDTLDWKYQAWLFDGRDTIAWRYNMGKFNGPNEPDNFQQCQMVLPGWNKPGQDWTIPDCPGGGPPNITDLTTNGRYILVITLEPKIETQGLAWPFYLVVFHGRIPSNFAYGQIEQLNNTVKLPTGEMTLAYGSR